MLTGGTASGGNSTSPSSGTAGKGNGAISSGGSSGHGSPSVPLQGAREAHRLVAAAWTATLQR